MKKGDRNGIISVLLMAFVVICFSIMIYFFVDTVGFYNEKFYNSINDFCVSHGYEGQNSGDCYKVENDTLIKRVVIKCPDEDKWCFDGVGKDE